MILDWNNPIGLGLFGLMAAGTVALLIFSVWLLSRVVPMVSGRNRR